ncbi:hypothetical protein ACQZV8_12630 [Magnetococcales bacterium HHB-1]
MHNQSKKESQSGAAKKEHRSIYRQPEGPKTPPLFGLRFPGKSLDEEILDPANPNLHSRDD